MNSEEKRQENGRRVENYFTDRRSRAGIIILTVSILISMILIVGSTSIFHHRNGFERMSLRDQMIGDGFQGRGMVEDSFDNGMMRDGFSRGEGMMRGDHGRGRITGQIISISGDNITVKDSSGTEYTVIVSDTTSFTKSEKIAKQSDLAVNYVITVSGSSNSQGQIEANSILIW